MSLLALGVAAIVLAASAPAAAHRYALLIGADRGDVDEPALRYAQADARKLGDVLLDLGGFAAEDVVVLDQPRVADARRALLALNQRAREADDGRPAVVVVYYSGHADADALHLGSERWSLDEVRQTVRGSAAAFRLLVLDACRSGAALGTRPKGGTRGPPFPLAPSAVLGAEGYVVLTASAAGEDAQESDALRGSYFTHHMVTALQGAGDANRDREVDLDEAYRYAFENTLRASSRSALGVQHPGFRYDLRGQGRIVLTWLDQGRGRGELEALPGRHVLVMRDDADGPVVAELFPDDRARRLALRPATYFVRARAASDLFEGTIAVRAGARAVMREDALRRVAYAQLVRKGGPEAGWVAGPDAGITLTRPLAGEPGTAWGGFAGWTIDLPAASLAARLGYARSGFANEYVAATTDQLELDLVAARVVDLGRWTAELGGLAGMAWIRQRFDATGTYAPARATFAPAIGLRLAVGREVVPGLDLALEGGASTYFRPLADEHGASRWGAIFVPRAALLFRRRFD